MSGLQYPSGTILLALKLVCLTGVFGGSGIYNATRPFIGPLQRDRRTLIFTDFGVHKYIAGFSIPVDLDDKKPWRSLAAVFNFQGQYGVPMKPLYWWNKWDGRTLQEAREQYDKYGIYAKDESRVFVYSMIEFYLKKTGRNGRKCLARAICENANVDTADDILSKIILAVLKPGDDSDEDYKDAYKAGRYGVKCITAYPECPYGQGFLDGLTIIEDKRYYSRKHKAIREAGYHDKWSIWNWDIWDDD